MFLRLGQQTHYNTKILRITPNSETAMNFIEINKSESDNFFPQGTFDCTNTFKMNIRHVLCVTVLQDSCTQELHQDKQM